MTRDELIDLLARAATRGGLGLFVGSGVPMALTDGSFTKSAPDFRKLLEQVAERLDLGFPEPRDCAGDSYPKIASSLVSKLEANGSDPQASHATAVRRFKGEVARLCHFQARTTVRDAFSRALRSINPAWVVSTNYDLLFDELLENANVLLPEQVMPTTREATPVYHIHGHRLVPESIIITEEDYVEILGQPNEYRQLKLSLLFSESTTLALGYALSDLNVLTAMRLAKFHEQEAPTGGRGRVVQALWRDEELENPEPYRGRHGEWILEITSIEELLSELAGAVARVRAERDEIDAQLEELTGEGALQLAREDREKRLGLFNALRVTNSRVLLTLDALFDPEWERARNDGGWDHYDTFLCIVLDAFEVWPTSDTQPAVFSYLVDRLGDVAYYVSLAPHPHVGQAFAASDTWKTRKASMDQRTLKELKALAADDYSRLRNLFTAEERS